MYIDPGPERQEGHRPDQQDLDVIHDMRPRRHDHPGQDQPDLQGLVQVVPLGASRSHPAGHHLNNERPGLDKKEVRWALTLAIDIVRVAMASYRGAATISAIHVPPTGMYPKYYFDPLEQWLKDFTIDVGGTPIQAVGRRRRRRRSPTKRARPWASGADRCRRDPQVDRHGLVEVRCRHGGEAAAGQGLQEDSNKKWLLPDGRHGRSP